MISIQFGASMAKHLFPLIGAIGVTAFRTGFACLVLLLVWQPWKRKIKLAEFKIIFLYGAFLGAMNLFFYLAIARAPLGITVAIEFTGPLLYALASSRKKIDILWVSLAGCGIFLILPMQAESHLDWLGIVFALLAGVCWAFYIHFGKIAGKQSHGGVVTSVGMFMAALVTVPVFAITNSWDHFDWSVVPKAFLVAMMSSAIPYSLEMYSLRNLPPTVFGVFLSLAPAMAAISGFLFLNETLVLLQWMAIVLVVLASAGSALTDHLQKSKNPTGAEIYS